MALLNWHGFRTAAWGGMGLLAAALLLVVGQGKWVQAATLGGFLGVALLFVRRERQLPTLFDVIFVGAALINAVGWAWNLFDQPGLYDEVAHAFTMFAITLALGFLLYNELMHGFYAHWVMFVVTIASMGIAIGALWEVVEWLADFVIPMQIVAGLSDTVTDLILDSAGAVLAAMLNLWGLNERARQERNTASAHE
jgi:hypothetical protein